MKKISAVITLLLLGGLILGLTVADFIKQDSIYSSYENRMLAKRPAFSLESLFTGTYTTDYETYITDQFVGRDNWVFVKTCTDVALGKKEVNGVFLAQDGTLIENHAPEDYTEEEMQQKLVLLENLQDWEENRGGDGSFYVMLVPTADNIRRSVLPNHATVFSQTDYIERVKETIGEDAFIDVTDTLLSHKEEKIYYATDHHWTTLGAYYGYKQWADVLGVEAVPYKTETVSTNFLGTLHSLTHLPVAEDTMEAYMPQVLWGDMQSASSADIGGEVVEGETAIPQGMQVYYNLSEEAKDTIFEPKHLETKNQYAYFLDDNQPFIRIETGATTEEAQGKKLFILKDSYANCLIPFLTEHYETVYVMDLRYFNGKLLPFMEEYDAEGEMDILVLYNVIHFIEEFRYF